MDAFTRDYTAAILFTEQDELGDKNEDDFAPEMMERIRADCAAFQAAEGVADILADESNHRPGSPDDTAEEHAGRDFWYTRNGHGVGFWDGDWTEKAESVLDPLAGSFGEVWVYVGDDGKVYVS